MNYLVEAGKYEFKFKLVTPEKRMFTVGFHRDETIGILKVSELLLVLHGIFSRDHSFLLKIFRLEFKKSFWKMDAPQFQRKDNDFFSIIKFCNRIIHQFIGLPVWVPIVKFT